MASHRREVFMQILTQWTKGLVELFAEIMRSVMSPQHFLENYPEEEATHDAHG